jgi:hypothetical protein
METIRRLNEASLACDLNFVRLDNVLERKSYNVAADSTLSTCLNDNDKRRLKERRVCRWVQDRRTGLE